MTNRTIAQQASIYIYDLNNCAKEFGFKTDEGWELSLANDADKKDIEKRYHPTITAKVFPEILAELFRHVTNGLNQVKSGLEKTLTVNSPAEMQLQYLVAYNPKRLRR